LLIKSSHWDAYPITKVPLAPADYGIRYEW